MSDAPKKLGRPRAVGKDYVSREAIRQTQENALRKLRRRMIAFGYKAEDFFDIWHKKGN